MALTTGADRGLGRAVTAKLLEEGWTVIAGRNLDWPELDELAVRFPDTLHLVPLDVASDASVTAAAEWVGKRVDHVDLLVSNAGINRSAHINGVREALDFDDMVAEYNVNALGGLRVVAAFLPLLDRGEFKRLCFVSSEAGSIGASRRTGWFGYCMSKAAINMAVKNLHNDLASQGYTFRLYHPGWMRTYMRGTKMVEANMEPEEAAEYALRYFLGPRDQEDLVLVDFEGHEYPW